MQDKFIFLWTNYKFEGGLENMSLRTGALKIIVRV